ncbi:TraK family protein [Pseudomonas helleri]|uniref:TraK family protein n=1 Tax=Pseudomonas helleri TaxID=1608996 RepID=UPI003FD1FF69
MGKNLSERIADRMRNKKSTVGAQNRGTFLALKSEIVQALDDHWPVKTIWETLHEEGKVTFSYQAFRNYVNSLVLGAKHPPLQKSPAINERSNNTPPPKKQAGVANTPAQSPKQTPVIAHAPTGFNFDANPKKEDYV